MFELGNVATTLLILRAIDLLHTDGRDLTAATSLAILLYVAHNVAATLCSLIAGQLSDRIGPRWVFAASGIVYVAGYVVFAIGPTGWPLLLLGFVLSGVGIGAAETAESTAVARMLPERLRGNGFGVLGLVQSVGDMGSTVLAGGAVVADLPAGGLRLRRGVDGRLRGGVTDAPAPHRHRRPARQLMSGPSILFNQSAQHPRLSAQQPDSYHDLALDQVVAALAAGRRQFELEPFFCTPPHSIDTITYRQEVFADLDGRPALAAARSFAEQLHSVRGHLEQVDKLHYQHQKTAWFRRVCGTSATGRCVDGRRSDCLKSFGG